MVVLTSTLPFVRILPAYDSKCQLLFETPVQLFNAMCLGALQACIAAAERLKEAAHVVYTPPVQKLDWVITQLSVVRPFA